jgi:hypothetical protein
MQEAERLLTAMTSAEKVQLLQLIARDLSGDIPALPAHPIFVEANRALQARGSLCGS